MKLVLLNVKYSPNLGDGVIAECLEYYFKARIDNLEIFSIDIGGMLDYESGGSILGRKLSVMAKIKQLPAILRDFTIIRILPLAITVKYGSRWRNELRGCDAIIIGGGHLIMDVDHYFPMRLLAALHQSRLHTPLCVCSVGVSRKMTTAGKQMLSDAFRHGHLVFLSVRDENSANNWVSHFGLPAPRIFPDPALLSFEAFAVPPFQRTRDTPRRTVALGVSDPASMSPHSDSLDGIVCGDIPFYLHTIRLLVQRYSVKIFTNGEDDKFLQCIAGEVALLPQDVRNQVTFLSRPVLPRELVAYIAEADVVVAHRLHANIVAFSLGIPHVGLGWDDKLKSFFWKTGRTEFLVVADAHGPSVVSRLVDRALEEGIDPDVHSRVIREVRDGLDSLIAAIPSK